MGSSKINCFDHVGVNQTKFHNRLIPTAPYDHDVGLIPEWVKVNNGTVTINYNIKEPDKTAVDDGVKSGPATNNLAEAKNNQLDTVKESAICTGDKSGLNYEINYTRITEIRETKVYNNKRKRTTTETSLPDIGGEHSTSSCSALSSFEKSCQTELHRSRSVSEGDNGMQCVCHRNASNRKPLRKIKKGLGWTAWIVASPLVLVINLMRTKDDYDDDDDKHNDPLRPWNYKINYVSPHKRFTST